MTTYLIYGVHKPFNAEQDAEWVEESLDDLYTGDCPDVGQITMLLGCNPYEADTICIGQILARIDDGRGSVAFQKIEMDHVRDGDIRTMVQMHAKEKQHEFSPYGTYLFSVCD